MAVVGLRELRQNASELVRRVENGEEITITVSGRPAARLVGGADPRSWRRWSEIDDLFHGRGDSEWGSDRVKIDDALRDPWATE